MGTIQQLYEAFSQVQLREELPALIEQTSNAIELLVITQLEQGKLSTGDSIQPSYASKYYSKKKYGMNSAPGYGIPDIKVTGKLYAATKVTASGDEYDIESDVSYAQSDQILQYGPELLAMSEESKEKYCEETLAPAIGNYIFSKTGIALE